MPQESPKRQSHLPDWAIFNSFIPRKHNGGFFKAPEETSPWAATPDASVSEKHLFDILQVQRAINRRMHRATRAFIVMMTGPIWGAFFANIAHTAVGITVGIAITSLAGVVAAYYRGS